MKKNDSSIYLADEDWIKNGQWDLNVRTLQQLFIVIGAGVDGDADVASEWVTQPVALNMPEWLIVDLVKYLDANQKGSSVPSAIRSKYEGLTERKRSKKKPERKRQLKRSVRLTKKKSALGGVNFDLKGLASIAPNASGGSSRNRVLKPAAFDPRAIDADNDGWRQEGTTAAWFGAGLNNPIVKKLKERFDQLGKNGWADSNRSNLIKLSKPISERINAPEPQLSNLEADLSFIIGHRLNSGGIQTRDHWGKSMSVRSVDDYGTTMLMDDANWLWGRELERKTAKQGDGKLTDPLKKKMKEIQKTRVKRDKEIKTLKGVQVDERTLERARNFVLNDSSDLELFKLFTFSFEDRNGGKYTTKIESAKGGDIIGQILNEDGQSVADFHRTLYVDKHGTMYVDHKLLSVKDNYKNSGIATAFNARNDQVYSSLGAERIDVFAASNPDRFNGSSHWPKVGFDWFNSYDRDSMLDLIDKAFKVHEEGLLDGENPPTFDTSDGRKLPMFASMQEMEELKTLVARARKENFNDENRLTAGDLVNWTSAEWWMKMKNFGINYSKLVSVDPKRGNKPHKPPLPGNPNPDDWVM